MSLTSIMSTTGHKSLPKPTKAARSALLAPPPKNPNDRDAIIERMMATYKAISSPGYPASDAERREMMTAQHERSYHPTGLVRQIAAIVASGDRRAACQKITAPTIVVHGEDDPLVPVEGGRDTAMHIRGAELLTIPGMGHDMPLQLLPAIADAVLNVSRRADATQATNNQAAE